MFRLIILSLLLLAGCATESGVSFGSCYNKTLPVLLDSTDLKGLFKGISAEFCPAVCQDGVAAAGAKELCPGESRGPTVLVTDFVDLQSFVPNPSGLLMGELMRASLNNVCNYEVLQGEFGKFFSLSDGGLVVLTRRAAEIKNNDYGEREAIVGTYSYLNNNKVILFARRVNTRTGKVVKMVSRELDYSCAGTLMSYTAH